MTGARLLALRLQGFKSFADRTSVEFGPGISAVVGPNGSGKSNLADGLRWALGEQGRALRSRKSEDVIFAGSDRRPALGMADVSLVLDNADGLLPLDFQVLELGRRLYRSGENDYLLNRGRVRLKDLVELLDGAHLADNAFLFIGQGMVDQALALRPEERRPLFEEVAGVRRHERRRRRAEEQLAEAEANLARVQDILGELRPQVRRLAAQADQQADRSNAGEALASALVASAHARWHAAAAQAAVALERVERTGTEVDRLVGALGEAEAGLAEIAAGLARRTAVELERRDALESARAALAGLQLAAGRQAAELEAARRDRIRLDEERAAAEAELAARRRALARPVPERDSALQASLEEAELGLADARRELAALEAASQAEGQERAALERAMAARTADHDAARRQLADAERRAAEERRRSSESATEHAGLEAALQAARADHRAAIEAELAAARDVDAARAEADAADGARRAADERAAASGAALAAIGSRLAAATARQAEEEARGIARAARRLGGRRVDAGLQVDPAFRAAVEAALGELARGYLVERTAVGELAGERGWLILASAAGSAGRPSSGAAGAPADVPPTAAFRDRLAAVGGGLLSDAIRRDELGAARTLLERTAWAPDLDAALELQPVLPPGWQVVVRDGRALVAGRAVALGRADGSLERQGELERIEAEQARLNRDGASAEAAAQEAAARAGGARQRVEAARAEEARIGAARRAAEEAERVAARRVERLAREAAWHEAAAVRTDAELVRRRAALADLEGAAGQSAAGDQPAGRDATSGDALPTRRASAIETWQRRVGDLRSRRDRLAAEFAEREGLRLSAEAAHARDEAGASISRDQIERADRQVRELAERETEISVERDRLALDLATAASREERLAAALAEVREADSVDRERLAVAESAVTAVRDRLRSAEDRHRSAEVAELETRLALDLIREQAVAEIGGLGLLGLQALGLPVPQALGLPAPDRPSAAVATNEEEGEAGPGIEEIPVVVLERWAATAPPGEPPSPARMATLRRRYHELGAANPAAIEEYAELKARLDGLEAQENDLREAIGTTRGLIDELARMVSEQFRTTFEHLEVAFDERFRQLFGGGYARLELTDPEDLSLTGVEIVARPPGKKAQALAMLSGGERALTAVALLFAMLAVRPVPFCVLDEVDAALDEANIGRFADALRSLADQTQFIVITHNRGTIEAADALYGVTVGDDSVSRVISLRLDEATAIAERTAAAS